MFECKECRQIFDSEKSLHGHFRKHNLLIKDYYEKHYPKTCLQTGKTIIWKEGDKLDSYLSRNFIDKTALNQYFDNPLEQEKKKTLLNNFLEDSYNRYSIIPSQVELASLACSPTLLIYSKYFSLSDLFINKNTRFNYNLNYQEPLPLKKIDIKDFIINIDSREQQEYRIWSSIKGKLEIGDYCIAGDSSLVIERKSIMDFGSTMVNGNDRFRRELDRAKASEKYVVVLVEFNIHDLFRHKFYGYSNPGLVASNMRHLIRDYSSVCQFVFGLDRKNCINYLIEFLLCGQECRNRDLQLYVDVRKSQFHKHEFNEEDLLALYSKSQ